MENILSKAFFCTALREQRLELAVMPIPVSRKRQGASALFLVLKGPNSSSDLMHVRASTTQTLARNTVKFLWCSEEIKSQMLIPKTKRVRASAFQRSDFFEFWFLCSL